MCRRHLRCSDARLTRDERLITQPAIKISLSRNNRRGKERFVKGQEEGAGYVLQLHLNIGATCFNKAVCVDDCSLEPAVIKLAGQGGVYFFAIKSGDFPTRCCFCLFLLRQGCTLLINGIFVSVARSRSRCSDGK